MKVKTLSLLVMAVLSVGTGRADIVYSNTSIDTLVTYYFSANNSTQIGDTISLGGTARSLNSASVQFYNNGASGTFSATLNLWNTGSPVGGQLGSFTVNGLSLGSGGILTVSFTSLNLVVPDNLVFTVAVSNLSSGSMDLGLNAFEPPSVGSSNSGQLILNPGGNFASAVAAPGQGNLYFLLDASNIPEPSTVGLIAAGGIALALGAQRRRSR